MNKTLIIFLLCLLLASIILYYKYKNSYYNKGIALSNLEKHEEAINSYDRAIKIDPDNINAIEFKKEILKAKNNL